MSKISILDAYSALRRELNLIFASELKQTEFGEKQMMVLFRLIESPASMGELSEFCQSDPAATTRTVASLEKAGLVKRVEDGEDCRRFIIHLTPKGRKRAAIADVIRLRLSEMVNKTLTTEEQIRFVKLLNKVVAGLRKDRN